MDYKLFYKPEFIKDMHPIELEHYLRKYSQTVGIIFVETYDGLMLTFPTSTMEAMLRTLEHYNKDANTIPNGTKWIYLNDIKREYKRRTDQAKLSYHIPGSPVIELLGVPYQKTMQRIRNKIKQQNAEKPKARRGRSSKIKNSDLPGGQLRNVGEGNQAIP